MERLIAFVAACGFLSIALHVPAVLLFAWAAFMPNAVSSDEQTAKEDAAWREWHRQNSAARMLRREYSRSEN